MSELSGSARPEAFDRDQLILDHVPLLKHVVGRMTFELPKSMDCDDLYGFGMIGLIHAADSWDPGRGLQFSTYAYTKIRGAILDELRKLDFLPRGRRQKVRDLDRTISRLEQELGVLPSPEEVANSMGLTMGEVDEIMLFARSASHVSMDDGISAELHGMLTDPKTEDPVGSAEWQETKRLLEETIRDLPEPDRDVITLYYGEELLLKQISELLNVTESRVSQIHTRALYRLNRALTNSIGSRT